MPKYIWKISVRMLVEFLYRNGDLEQGATLSSEKRMLEGGRIHRKIQKSMGLDYQAEQPLKYLMEMENYEVLIEGRADGIITGKTAEKLTETKDSVIIDEIKGTYGNVEKMEEPVKVHLMQALCYACFYVQEHAGEKIFVQLTYCNMETEEKKYFLKEYSQEELHDFLEGLLREYKRWMDYRFHALEERQAGIKELSFPFPYRKGQKELMTHIYHSIYHKKKLFLEAPTGVGKTIATIFPAVKAMGEGMADRIFYFSAKTVTAAIAENTYEILRTNGLKFKSVILTAKDKICFLEKRDCNPESCPYAKGHYDRINDALYDLITGEYSFGRETIERYAGKYMVCPFELALDSSLFSDGIICDYNYLFDPHVHLKRFFGEGKKEEYLFLIDEAHNLPDRGREMYSATLRKEDFLEMKKCMEGKSAKLAETCNRKLRAWKKDGEERRTEADLGNLCLSLQKLQVSLEADLSDGKGGENREKLLLFYFDLSHFLLIWEIMNDSYVIYSLLLENGDFIVKLFCMNPAMYLGMQMECGRSSVLFSGTFLPIQYYKGLLGGDREDYEVYAESVFSPSQLGLFIASDVSGKYTRRTKEEYRKVAEYIYGICSCKKGNYMVFSPSYRYMEEVYSCFNGMYSLGGDSEVIMQTGTMTEADREEFLHRFEEGNKTVLAFCVLGGIFSEGVDLTGDRLIGSIIIGAGLPQPGREREYMREYFEKTEGRGFDFAYRYPGMNKVMQAAGRVIRTLQDRGVVFLLDERFLQKEYRVFFPREWGTYHKIKLEELTVKLEMFWKEQDDLDSH